MRKKGVSNYFKKIKTFQICWNIWIYKSKKLNEFHILYAHRDLQQKQPICWKTKIKRQPWKQEENNQSSHTRNPQVYQLISQYKFWRLDTEMKKWQQRQQRTDNGDFYSCLSKYFFIYFISCCCLVDKPCLILCDPMNCSMPGFLALHYLPKFAAN